MLSGEGMLRRKTVKNNNGSKSLVFICRKNPRRSGILLLSDCPRFCRLMKTRNRKYPRSSWMDGDKSGESGAFLFSCASQISAMVGDHSRQMKTQICIVGDVGNGFRSLPIPQIAGLQSAHHASFNFWRTFRFRPNSSGESERELWRLSDISGTVGKK